MHRLSRNIVRACVLAALAAAVGACSSDTSINVLPKASALLRPDWLSYSGNKEEFTLRSVGPADLVGPEGQCQAAGGAQGTPDDGSLVQGGIALQMTECDVVRRAGTPDRVEVGSNERGERASVLTYGHGSRPGIYRFADGRLSSIERAPEAPAPEKPKKPAPRKRG
jgi:hypothetical protein